MTSISSVAFQAQDVVPYLRRERAMDGKSGSIESDAEVLRKIDEQLKGVSADVRAEAFQILVERHLGRGSSSPARSNKPPSAQPKKQRSTKQSTHPTFVKELDLKKSGNTPGLREFYSQKGPGNFTEQNAVFVYYLNRIREIEDVTTNHVFTCYKEVGARLPGALYQSLLDTNRNKGWIDTSNMGKILISPIGENFVEHDLPRKNKA
jgi:hypothetical protein